jgi:beta-glucanase (GH16 family)
MGILFLFLLHMMLNAFDREHVTLVKSRPEEYKLVWSDEFNTDGRPDSSKWRFETGFVRNEEAQWYQVGNAVCKDGLLVIEGRRERKPNPNFEKGSTSWKKNREHIEYTSSSVVMKREHAFKYGKLEVRAKIDAQTGLWPAIWTLGVDGEWPSNGEVDIMEYYDNRILGNFAFSSDKRYTAIWDEGSKTVATLGGASWANQFHIWTLEWNEKSMRILIDGQMLNDINLSQTINKSDGKNPFHQPHYVLLNLAMGGTRGGSLDNTILPSRYLVDYVRVYQQR